MTKDDRHFFFCRNCGLAFQTFPHDGKCTECSDTVTYYGAALRAIGKVFDVPEGAHGPSFRNIEAAIRKTLKDINESAARGLELESRIDRTERILTHLEKVVHGPKGEGN